MTTMQVSEKPRIIHVPVGPEANVVPETNDTSEPAFENATEIIARVVAMDLERFALAESSLYFAAEQSEWSEASLPAQAETLPEQ